MARRCSMMPYLQPGMPMPKDLRGLGVPSTQQASFYSFTVDRALAPPTPAPPTAADPTVDELQKRLRSQEQETREQQVLLILGSTGITVLTTLLAASGQRGLATAITVFGALGGAFWAITSMERGA